MVEGIINNKSLIGEIYNGWFQRSYWEHLKDRGRKIGARTEKTGGVRGYKHEEAEIGLWDFIFCTATNEGKLIEYAGYKD